MPEVHVPKSNLTRRQIFPSQSVVLRPPWSTEQSIRAECTSCGQCLRACPEGILVAGPAKTPTIDFTAGECTFCAACVSSCDEDVFAPSSMAPWTLTARVEDACLLQSGVSCRSCSDMCDQDALLYDLRVGGVGGMRVDHDICTGCGACVAACPVSAITVSLFDAPTKEPAE